MPQESTTDHVSNGGAGEGIHNTTVDKGSFGEKNTMAERRQSLTVMLFASKRGQMRQPQTTKSGFVVFLVEILVWPENIR